MALLGLCSHDCSSRASASPRRAGVRAGTEAEAGMRGRRGQRAGGSCPSRAPGDTWRWREDRLLTPPTCLGGPNLPGVLVKWVRVLQGSRDPIPLCSPLNPPSEIGPHHLKSACGSGLLFLVRVRLKVPCRMASCEHRPPSLPGRSQTALSSINHSRSHLHCWHHVQRKEVITAEWVGFCPGFAPERRRLGECVGVRASSWGHSPLEAPGTVKVTPMRAHGIPKRQARP